MMWNVKPNGSGTWTIRKKGGGHSSKYGCERVCVYVWEINVNQLKVCVCTYLYCIHASHSKWFFCFLLKCYDLSYLLVCIVLFTFSLLFLSCYLDSYREWNKKPISEPCILNADFLLHTHTFTIATWKKGVD